MARLTLANLLNDGRPLRAEWGELADHDEWPARRFYSFRLLRLLDVGDAPQLSATDEAVMLYLQALDVGSDLNPPVVTGCMIRSRRSSLFGIVDVLSVGWVARRPGCRAGWAAGPRPRVVLVCGSGLVRWPRAGRVGVAVRW